MVIMDPKELTKEEYELQFYGFTVATLFAAFRNMVIKEVSDAMQELKSEGMKVEGNEVYLSELEAHEKYCMEWIEEPLQKLKSIFISSLSIPEYVVLHSDRCHQEHEKDIEEIRKEVRQLEEEFKQAVLYQEVLERRYDQVKALEPLVESSKEFLQQYSQNVTPATTSEVDDLLEELEDLVLPASDPLKHYY